MDAESLQKSVFKDDQTQKELNAPLSDPTGASEEDKEFLRMVLSMIESGEIDMLKPSSLINVEVYNKLSESQQGRTDLEALNLLAAIRQIRELDDQEVGMDTFQMQNLVERVKNTKERLEEEGGDLFII